MKKELPPKKIFRLPIWLIPAVIILIGVALSDVSARPFRLDVLPDSGAGFRCGTCHINPSGGGSRNVFGKDYQQIALPAGEKFTDELSKKDSDEDGATNKEEFEAGTHPGDPESKPAK